MSELREISTDGAPAAIGPYSQAIVCDGWIYASGQIPLDPETGNVAPGDVAAQTRQAPSNLEAVLAAAGGSLTTVVKTTVYLSDMANFSPMNQVYSEYFGAHRPARATIEAGRLPRDVSVEIDAVARVAP